MTNEETGAWVGHLLATGQVHKFYTSPQWERLRAEVLAEHHGECVWCRQHGKYTPAVVVHHQWHVKKYPMFALSKTVKIAGKEEVNLLPLCKACHELAHPDRMVKHVDRPPPLTPERW